METLSKEIRESLNLFVVLMRAAKSVTTLSEKSIRESGLNPTEFAILELLFHKGSQPIQLIGKKVLIASSSITYVVDKLEEKHLVIRIPGVSDRRVIMVEITQKGTDLISDFFPQHARAIHEAMNGIRQESKMSLKEQLKRLGLHARNIQE